MCLFFTSNIELLVNGFPCKGLNGPVGKAIKLDFFSGLKMIEYALAVSHIQYSDDTFMVLYTYIKLFMYWCEYKKDGHI